MTQDNKNTTPDLDALDELIDDLKQRRAAPAAPVAPDQIDRLKALINQAQPQHRPVAVHPSDMNKDPTWVRDAAAICGDIAVHARMFLFDKQNNRERTPDEVRSLVTNMCRKRGTSGVFDLLLGWNGFRPTQLPKDVQDRWIRLLGLPEDFFVPNGGAQ
jgi:hypothetical protein